MDDNSPANFEAMGLAYSIALLCSKSKVSQGSIYVITAIP